MTPLFKKYEQAQRSLCRLFGEGYRGRRCLFKGAFEDLQVGKNFRFLDVITQARPVEMPETDVAALRAFRGFEPSDVGFQADAVRLDGLVSTRR